MMSKWKSGGYFRERPGRAACPPGTRYVVWAGGVKSCHRKYRNAERAAVEAQNWSSEVQIDDARTGRKV